MSRNDVRVLREISEMLRIGADMKRLWDQLGELEIMNPKLAESQLENVLWLGLMPLPHPRPRTGHPHHPTIINHELFPSLYPVSWHRKELFGIGFPSFSSRLYFQATLFFVHLKILQPPAPRLCPGHSW